MSPSNETSFGMTWMTGSLFICVAVPRAHDVKVATAHHTFKRMWCKGGHGTSHFWTFSPNAVSTEWPERQKPAYGTPLSHGAHSTSTPLSADVLVWAHHAFVLRWDSWITCTALLFSVVLYVRVTIKLEALESGVYSDRLCIEKATTESIWKFLSEDMEHILTD